mgnify:CR=1 FL=1
MFKLSSGNVWIFDLDNTLHDASHYAFSQMNSLMTDFIIQELGVEISKADQIRELYWKKYGATLLGLIRHHGVNPKHFLAATHDFKIDREKVPASYNLRYVLQTLNGKKYIFSNAPFAYVEKVLSALRVRFFFDDIFTIESTNYRPKPDLLGFRAVLRAIGVTGNKCTMVEDSVLNLRVAKILGMRTVWLNRGVYKPKWVDRKIKNLSMLLR